MSKAKNKIKIKKLVFFFKFFYKEVKFEKLYSEMNLLSS